VLMGLVGYVMIISTVNKLRPDPVAKQEYDEVMTSIKEARDDYCETLQKEITTKRKECTKCGVDLAEIQRTRSALNNKNPKDLIQLVGYKQSDPQKQALADELGTRVTSGGTRKSQAVGISTVTAPKTTTVAQRNQAAFNRALDMIRLSQQST